MTVPRLFQKIPLGENKVINLSLSAAHYLGTVRRVRENDEIIIFNGEGGEYSAQVLEIKKEKFTIKILSYHDTSRESPFEIHLAQGIARGEKMDFIIQKAVELGVKKIIPLFTERSSVKLDQERRIKKQEHWQATAISACEQSGRNKVPEIELPINYTEWVKGFSGCGIILHPDSQNKISGMKFSQQEPLTILIGPEGGLNSEEIDIASNKFISINLGPRILRTETAPLAVIAILQAKFGDICN
jgi:16S rRNA (uracil1498-N3)-methyltransferase